MESTDQIRQGTCQGTNLKAIDRIPDELLLEIFDFYRQSFNRYHVFWRDKYAWFNLAHVCRSWRAIIFASSSCMDISVIVGPDQPPHIKSILSSHLPITIDYTRVFGLEGVKGNPFWRLRAALGHRDRVREIFFRECGGVTFEEFIRATSHHFPALERLILVFPNDYEPDIPATFLRGSDRSELRLPRLALRGGSAAFLSGFCSSVAGLTELTLIATSNVVIIDPSQGLSLLACLQGMQCLRILDLATPYDYRELLSESQHSVPKDNTVPMSALIYFRYSGLTSILNDLMSGLSAPALRDATLVLNSKIPLLYLNRFIDDVRKEFRSVSVTFEEDPSFHLLSSTNSGEIDHFMPSPFRLLVNCVPDSIIPISSTPSTKLAMVEELTLNFSSSNLNLTKWNFGSSLRIFLRQFRSVRVLRVNPFVQEVGIYLQQEDIMPALEEVQLTISCLCVSVEEYENCVAEELAAFGPCERAGCLVKVHHN